ncbi:complex I intermediate-associated protein 30, mitochondrial-like [Vespa mandarinia]|uniref:complex I intermediate-associated protein 30, mitochondrial-like n=1 Tax=Vespa mandarinia TaxID=7446 RepID=UPI00160F1B04|nr:complex I intermediate-associated protein 30, mitochondrial-like [Vespa mandarinia]
MNFLTRAILFNRPVMKKTFDPSYRLIHAYQQNERSDYPKVYDRPPKKVKLSLLQQAKKGYFHLIEELALLKKEIKEKRKDNLFHPSDEVDIVWDFNGNQKSLDPWLIVCDSDYNEGYSTCKLELSPEGKAVFSGNLDYRIPKDGKITYAGYCALKTAKFRKSFKRETRLDWQLYNHLVMRVRGDGRTYMINIGTKGLYDIHWNDLYNYVIYTRGGPYWQYVKIPFSKFFLSSHGRIQDDQEPIALDNISSFGVIASDKIPGPFKLEIDYIGVVNDPFEWEEFAYEMYNVDGILF